MIAVFIFTKKVMEDIMKMKIYKSMFQFIIEKIYIYL